MVRTYASVNQPYRPSKPGLALHRLVLVKRSQKLGRVVGFNFATDCAVVGFMNGVRVEIPYDQLQEVKRQP